MKKGRKKQENAVKKKHRYYPKRKVIPLTPEQQMMVEKNQGLIGKMVKRYLNRGLSFEDLYSEGQFGLSRGVQEFDKTRGYRFSTYALWWIRQAITRAIDNEATEIRLPVHQRDKLRKIYKQELRLFKKLGREATRQELAQAMNMTEKEIDNLTMLANGVALSLNAESDEDGRTLEDFVPDDKISDIDAVMVRNLAKDQVERLLDCLTDKEEKVIRMRFGIGCLDRHTLEEVGDQMGVTRERIRQIEMKALVKLRNNSEGRMFKFKKKASEQEEEPKMKKNREEVVALAKQLYEQQKQGIRLDKLAIEHKKCLGYINMILGLARDPGVAKHYLEGLTINSAYALIGLPPEEQDKFAKRIKEKGLKEVGKQIVARKKKLGIKYNRTVKIKKSEEVDITNKQAQETSGDNPISEHKISGNNNHLEIKDSIRRRAMFIIESLDKVGLDGKSSILVKQGQILLSELELMQLELRHTKFSA